MGEAGCGRGNAPHQMPVMDLEETVACNAEMSESPGDGRMDRSELVQEKGGAPDGVDLPKARVTVGPPPAESG